MNYKGKKILKDVFEITSKERISFREIFGLTFVFKTSKISYKNSHFNGEVKAALFLCDNGGGDKKYTTPLPKGALCNNL